MADKAFPVSWGDDQPEQAPVEPKPRRAPRKAAAAGEQKAVADPVPAPTPQEPAGTAATGKAPARKRAAASTAPASTPAPPDVAAAQAQAPVYALAALAADPAAYIEALPAVKRGLARKPLNIDVPPDLGERVVAWCRDHEISQRDLFRGLLVAMFADVDAADQD